MRVPVCKINLLLILHRSLGNAKKTRTLTQIDKNIKTRFLTLGLILLAGIPTSLIDVFSHPAIIFLLPGLLFGLALTIPHFNKSRKEIIALLTFPVVMIFLCSSCIGIGLSFGFINHSNSDHTGVIIVGVISSLFFLNIYDHYYPIKNRKISYAIILVLGITSTLICDYLFLTPHSKELNLGKMIVIWEVLMGFGLTLFVRYDLIVKQNEKIRHTIE